MDWEGRERRGKREGRLKEREQKGKGNVGRKREGRGEEEGEGGKREEDEKKLREVKKGRERE